MTTQKPYWDYRNPTGVQDTQLKNFTERVQQDISKNNSKTKEEFLRKVKYNAQKKGISEEQEFNEALDYINKNDIVYKGINDNPALVKNMVLNEYKKEQESKQGRFNPFTRPEDTGIVGNIVKGSMAQVLPSIKNTGSFLVNIMDKVSKDKDGNKSLGRKVIGNAMEKIILAGRKAVGNENTKIPENLLQGLAQAMIDEGIDTKQKWQNTLGVNPDKAGIGIGEFITNVAGPDKFLKVTKAGKLLGPVAKQGEEALALLGEKAPKVAKALSSIYETMGIKGGLNGIKDVVGYEAASSGEADLSDAAIGLGVGAAFEKVGKVLQTPGAEELKKKMFSRMSKLATKLSPSSTNKLIIDKNIYKSLDGAAYIRQMNPDLKIYEEGSLGTILEASQKTRKSIIADIQKEKGIGNVDINPVISWIDDAIKSFTKSGHKNTQLSKDELRVLTSLNSDTVINTLNNIKKDLTSPSKQNLTLDMLDDIIITKNSMLSSLYNRITQAGEKQALQVESAVNSKLIELLDNSIQGDKKVFRYIKKIYGDVRTFEDNINKIYAQFLRKKDKSLGDFADVFIYSNAVQAIVTQDYYGLAKSGVQKLIKERVKLQNDPEFVIKTLFEDIDKMLNIPAQTIKQKIKSTPSKSIKGVDDITGIDLGDITKKSIGAGVANIPDTLE